MFKVGDIVYKGTDKTCQRKVIRLDEDGFFALEVTQKGESDFWPVGHVFSICSQSSYTLVKSAEPIYDDSWV